MNTCETIPSSSRITSNKRAAACDLDGEMVILNLDSGVYFGLNAVGASVWHLVQTNRTVAEVIDQLASEYRVDRQRCEMEVSTLLQEMARHGLIEIQTNVDAA